MKKTLIYILIAAVVLPLFTSCDDMLDEKNYGNPTTEDMMGKDNTPLDPLLIEGTLRRE